MAYHEVCSYLYKIKSVNISVWIGGAYEVPPLAEELLAVDGYLGKQSNFSLGLVGYSCSGRQPHTQEHAGSTNLILWANI